jgi:predicted amidohydrolase
MQRRTFLTAAAAIPVAVGLRESAESAEPGDTSRTIRVSLIQFDSVPEQVSRNREQMERLARDAAIQGARWIVFHEGTVCDYTDRLGEFAEGVPDGPSTQQMLALAKELDVCLSFGLSERDGERYYITQVFVGPQGLIHRYRKTWLWRSPEDLGYRNEWVRYDPGTGPELFEVDGVSVSCFICADGNSQRCLNRLHDLHPQIVFHPNNRKSLGDSEEYSRRAQAIGAPLLVPNRTGQSWMHACDGGSMIVASDGAVLARANREGREEILVYDLQILSD